MPDVSEFDTAMMQPALSVPAIRHLGGGSIRLNEDGRPLRVLGRDAVVYELRTLSGRILALRAFLTPDRRRDRMLGSHYRELRRDAHLENLRGAAGPLPRDIQWIEEGIALPGPNLQRVNVPLMAMERVPGRTMVRTVDRLCREGQREPLALLADSWLATATALERYGFVHGDLAADNLIVRPDGTIALIDLDTAVWPTSAVPREAPSGTPAYVHPSAALAASIDRDRFPSLVLWASLRVLALHPTLREHSGDHPDRYGAALLWSQADFRNPERSPVFAALDALDDEPLLPLLEIVRRALRFPAGETPPLSEIAERLDSLGLPMWASRTTPGSRRSRLPAIPSSTTSESAESAALNANAVQPWAEDAAGPAVGSVTEPAADTRVTTTLAHRDHRRAAVQKLQAAIAARDTEEALRLWNDARAIPEAALHAAALHGLVLHDATVLLERAMRRRDDDGLVAAVVAAEGIGVAPSGQVRSALRAAQERISTREALQQALERGDLASLADLKRTGALDGLGRLDPSVERAIGRALAWPALERALLQDDDAAIDAAADPAFWRQNEIMPPGVWARVDLARRRRRWIEEVRAALRKRDAPVLRSLLKGAPPSAEERLTEVEGRRILRFTMREAAVERLERALRLGPDREVVAALAELESAGAPFTDVLDWAAVRGVVDRISLADALRDAATSNPPDTAKLARLLPAARAALGGGSAPGAQNWIELEQAVLRTAHLARLREAIATDDDARIASAADPDPYGTREFLRSDERDRVAQALALQQRHRA
jgi:hypothetical protein